MRVVIDGDVVLEVGATGVQHSVNVVVEGEINDLPEVIAEKYKATVKKLREEDK